VKRRFEGKKEGLNDAAVMMKVMTDVGVKHLELALGLTQLIVKPESYSAEEVFSVFESSIEVVKENFPLGDFLEQAIRQDFEE